MPPNSVDSDETRLLVEAVSLLLERAREMELTIGDHFRRTQRRSAEAAQRWSELEERLSRIEVRLATLAPLLEPGSTAMPELVRLRDAVASLPSQGGLERR